MSTVEVDPCGRRRKGERWALVNGPNSKQSVEPPLDVVLELIHGVPRETIQVRREGSTIALAREGVLVADLHRAVRKAFKPLDAYRGRHVAPALVNRGLLEVTLPREGRRATEFDWTAAGREADAQLHAGSSSAPTTLLIGSSQIRPARWRSPGRRAARSS